jgi:glutamyl-Q tRNA(Asp) synthetase
LVAAVASYADARHHQGQWLVRIEDVDETRSRDGADRQILAALQRFGMKWDAPPVYQSDRKALYGEALDRLGRAGHLYRCNCSRKQWASTATMGAGGPIYPGNCREHQPAADVPAALRIRVDDTAVSFDDRVAGHLSQDLAQEVGDFVVKRTDGFTAYQLAVVVDDAAQKITDVVRGADLLWSTPRQIWIQHRLELPTPRYAHVPLVRDADGAKLSKHTNADPVDNADPTRSLVKAWDALGQLPAPSGVTSPATFWAWAIPNWRIEAISAQKVLNDA